MKLKEANKFRCFTHGGQTVQMQDFLALLSDNYYILLDVIY